MPTRPKSEAGNREASGVKTNRAKTQRVVECRVERGMSWSLCTRRKVENRFQKTQDDCQKQVVNVQIVRKEVGKARGV